MSPSTAAIARLASPVPAKSQWHGRPRGILKANVPTPLREAFPNLAGRFDDERMAGAKTAQAMGPRPRLWLLLVGVAERAGADAGTKRVTGARKPQEGLRLGSEGDRSVT